MKRLASFLACLLVAGCATLRPDPGDDVTLGVRNLLARQEAAWNRGDLEGFMEGYWNSPNLVFYSGGDRTDGWRTTLERYRKRYKAESKEMGRLTFSAVEVESLDADAAFTRGAWRLDFEKAEPKHVEGLFTLVLKRLPEGWRIVHDHTSIPDRH